jgi:hypothetical protein
VAQLLRAGCAHMRKAFDIEDIKLATSYLPILVLEVIGL